MATEQKENLLKDDTYMNPSLEILNDIPCGYCGHSLRSIAHRDNPLCHELEQNEKGSASGSSG